MELLAVVLLIVFLATVGEGINEFFFLPWFDRLKEDEPAEETPEERKKRLWRETVRVQLMRLWSGTVGVLIILGVVIRNTGEGVCVFSLLGAEFNPPIAGKILTGLLVGRGSNYIHELLKKFTNPAKE